MSVKTATGVISATSVAIEATLRRTVKSLGLELLLKEEDLEMLEVARDILVEEATTLEDLEAETTKIAEIVETIVIDAMTMTGAKTKDTTEVEMIVTEEIVTTITGKFPTSTFHSSLFLEEKEIMKEAIETTTEDLADTKTATKDVITTETIGTTATIEEMTEEILREGITKERNTIEEIEMSIRMIDVNRMVEITEWKTSENQAQEETLEIVVLKNHMTKEIEAQGEMILHTEEKTVLQEETIFLPEETTLLLEEMTHHQEEKILHLEGMILHLEGTILLQEKSVQLGTRHLRSEIQAP